MNSNKILFRAMGERRCLLMLALLLGWPMVCRAQSETARVSVPSSLTFHVTDIRAALSRMPEPFVLRFSNLHLAPGHRLRVSVRANSPLVTSPGGTSVSCSLVSWSVRDAVGGVGLNGVLSASAFSQVFLGTVGASSGTVDLAWSLAGIESRVRAGTHSLSLTWKLESVSL